MSDPRRAAAARRGTATRAAPAAATGRPSARVDTSASARPRAAARAPRRSRPSPSPAGARCRSAAGSAATSSTGTPSTVTPSTRRSSRSRTATICGQRHEPVERRPVADGDEHEPVHELAPASQLAGRDAAQRRGDRAPRAPAPGCGSGRAAAGCGPRASAARSFASVVGPIPGASRSRPASAASRSSSAVRIPSARPSATSRCGRSPRKRPERDELGLDLALELRELRDPPVSTSSRSRRSIPGPIPRSSRTRPLRTSSATGAGVARMRSAARRYARTLQCAAPGEVEQRRVGVELRAISALSTWLVSPHGDGGDPVRGRGGEDAAPLGPDPPGARAGDVLRRARRVRPRSGGPAS